MISLFTIVTWIHFVGLILIRFLHFFLNGIVLLELRNLKRKMMCGHLDIGFLLRDVWFIFVIFLYYLWTISY